MIERHTYGQFVWIDIESPTLADIEETSKNEVLMSEPLMNELLYPSARGRLFKDGEAICITLHFPVSAFHHANKHADEIDFVITKDKLITTRFSNVVALHEAKQKLKLAQDLNRLPVKSGFDLFAVVISELYSAIDPELQKIDWFTIDAEKNIYEGKQKLAVEQISRTTKRILNVRHAIQYHTEVFGQYRELMIAGHTHGAVDTIDQLIREASRLVLLIDEQKTTLEEFAHTNRTLLSTHNENVMKIFTILAFITFPLALFVSILALNDKVHDFANTTGGLFTLIGIAIAIGVIMIAYFKYKKWI